MFHALRRTIPLLFSLALLAACERQPAANVPLADIYGTYQLKQVSGTDLPVVTGGLNGMKILGGTMTLGPQNQYTHTAQVQYWKTEGGWGDTQQQQFSGTFERRGDSLEFVDSYEKVKTPGSISGTTVTHREWVYVR